MKRKNVSKYFGCMVFDDRVMKARLSAKVYQSLRKTIDEGVKLDSSVADAVAEAMKAVSYTHLDVYKRQVLWYKCQSQNEYPHHHVVER